MSQVSTSPCGCGWGWGCGCGCGCCCCCCSLGPLVTAHRIMLFLLFLCFLLFFPLFIAQKIQDFLRCSSGWGLGVWGFGGVLGGWVSGRGWGGGIIAFMCVCVLSFGAFPFLITVVSVFFPLRQDVIFFVWRVWFCYCPCCLDRVRDLWFFWVGFEGFVFICVI